ncbi:hypothetical protein K457DRAFT_135341 [Linnemannia elongata AG-77]|uniref:Uncharacterized protein n=1 Tax=Linnemannia elongata AG-77 TaxID=1314771 RepID=A0A197K7M9_9FUNG|nr:hypothetical protein K457DRAFT_135341 [Linnemannia elongata AG-77]
MDKRMKESKDQCHYKKWTSSCSRLWTIGVSWFTVGLLTMSVIGHGCLTKILSCGSASLFVTTSQF